MRTLLLIKPGVAEEYGSLKQFLDAIIGEKLVILGIRSFTFSREMAEEFYAPHKGKEFYERLIEYMTSGKVVAIEIEGETSKNNAVKIVRNLCGATDPQKAKEGTLRQHFGSNITKNAVHSSDSPEAAERELKIVFG